ncbi:MAG: heme-binding domain-containing protein [Acidimicrobiales bacterium]
MGGIEAVKRVLSYWWFKALLGALGVFLLIQMVPYRVDNPPARDEPAWDSPETRALAERACFSCHSNETKVLSFEKVAPISWYVANHVKEGRSALNFSEWHTTPGEEADDAAESVGRGMPLSSYTAFGLHKEAKLTAAEQRQLIDGLDRTIAADPPSGEGHRGKGGG